MKYKIRVEIVKTGITKTFEREGIENTLAVAREFMWKSLGNPTTRAVDTQAVSPNSGGLTLHAPVGSVAGIENSKDVESDRPKAACPEEYHVFQRLYTSNEYCPKCGKLLSSWLASWLA